MSFVMSLDIDDFIQLVSKALLKREEQKAWSMWLMKYPHMDEQSFIPFSQFFKAQKQENISQRPAEDILKEADEIRKKIHSKKSGE
jgi:hypothetical protein